MKSRRMPLVWLVSVALHACFAVLVAYFAISSVPQHAQDSIDLSFFIVTPPQAAKRDIVAKPAVVPTPVPDLRVVPQTETTERRTAPVRTARASTSAPAAASLATSAPAAPRGQQITVLNTAPVTAHAAHPISTATDLPMASDGLPPAGLPSEGAFTEGIGEGIGDGAGNGAGRGAFGTGSGFGKGRTQNRAALNTFVDGSNAANINAALSDVTQNIVLGNGVPELPKGTPGAIIQGRGTEIIGSLNLVRLDDPLHPNLDI